MSGIFERANQLAVYTVGANIAWVEHILAASPRGALTEEILGVPLQGSPTIYACAELPLDPAPAASQTATVDVWLYYASLPDAFESKWVRAPDSTFEVTTEAPLIVRGQVGGATRVALVASGTDAAAVHAAVGRSILDRTTGV